MRLFVDMDQVLVNFLGGAKRALGKEFNDPALGPVEDRWALLAKVPHFWMGLDWMPGAPAFWRHLQAFTPTVLSACPVANMAPCCAFEKKEWCRIHLDLPPDRVHAVKREDKHTFAMSDGKANLLIDDHPANIADWKAAGGFTILHVTIPETMAALQMWTWRFE